jgi:hypothetical protein
MTRPGMEAFLDSAAAVYNALPMDAQCFRAWAKLMRGRSSAVAEDAMIAACAQTHGLTVVTRNTKHFRDLGVPLVNPQTAAPPIVATCNTECFRGLGVPVIDLRTAAPPR